MLVGSAPQFPHGSVDNIVEIAKLGQQYGIPVHVDACLGNPVFVDIIANGNYPRYDPFLYLVLNRFVKLVKQN